MKILPIRKLRPPEFIEVSAVYRFCYKPEPRSFKILYDNVYTCDNVLAVEIYNSLFPYVSLHEDLVTHSTHCTRVILTACFQFPHWVMKNVLFPGYYNNQTYLPFMV